MFNLMCLCHFAVPCYYSPPKKLYLAVMLYSSYIHLLIKTHSFMPCVDHLHMEAIFL